MKSRREHTIANTHVPLGQRPRSQGLSSLPPSTTIASKGGRDERPWETRLLRQFVHIALLESPCTGSVRPPRHVTCVLLVLLKYLVGDSFIEPDVTAAMFVYRTMQ